MIWPLINFMIAGFLILGALICMSIWFQKTESNAKWFSLGIIGFTGAAIGFLMWGQYTLDVHRKVGSDTRFMSTSEFMSGLEQKPEDDEMLRSLKEEMRREVISVSINEGLKTGKTYNVPVKQLKGFQTLKLTIIDKYLAAKQNVINAQTGTEFERWTFAARCKIVEPDTGFDEITIFSVNDQEGNNFFGIEGSTLSAKVNMDEVRIDFPLFKGRHAISIHCVTKETSGE